MSERERGQFSFTAPVLGLLLLLLLLLWSSPRGRLGSAGWPSSEAQVLLQLFGAHVLVPTENIALCISITAQLMELNLRPHRVGNTF